MPSTLATPPPIFQSPPRPFRSCFSSTSHISQASKPNWASWAQPLLHTSAVFFSGAVHQPPTARTAPVSTEMLLCPPDRRWAHSPVVGLEYVPCSSHLVHVLRRRVESQIPSIRAPHSALSVVLSRPQLIVPGGLLGDVHNESPSVVSGHNRQ